MRPLQSSDHVPLPLNAPPIALAVIAIGSEVDIPHTKLVIMVMFKPTKIVGFRPNLSEARPQKIAVKH